MPIYLCSHYCHSHPLHQQHPRPPNGAGAVCWMRIWCGCWDGCYAWWIWMLSARKGCPSLWGQTWKHQIPMNRSLLGVVTARFEYTFSWILNRCPNAPIQHESRIGQWTTTSLTTASWWSTIVNILLNFSCRQPRHRIRPGSDIGAAVSHHAGHGSLAPRAASPGGTTDKGHIQRWSIPFSCAVGGRINSFGHVCIII